MSLTLSSKIMAPKSVFVALTSFPNPGMGFNTQTPIGAEQVEVIGRDGDCDKVESTYFTLKSSQLLPCKNESPVIPKLMIFLKSDMQIFISNSLTLI